MVPTPAEHHPELLLKVAMPKLPAGSCGGKSRSPLAKACRGGAGPAGGCPCGETPRSTPALGCREGVPALAWTAFALCLLENKICRGLQNTGTAAALPAACYRRKKPPQGSGISTRSGGPTAITPSRGRCPEAWSGHRKRFVQQSPLCWSCAAGCLSTGRRDAPWLPSRHRAAKGFAPNSKDMTVATTGGSQWRCQMWRGNVRSSPWKPTRTSFPAGNVHPSLGHPPS